MTTNFDLPYLDSNPFYISPWDHASLAPAPMFDGSHFNRWKQLFARALKARNKFGFVDGSIKRPQESSNLFAQWGVCDSRVFCWMLNCLKADIRHSITNLETAHEAWVFLCDTFSETKAAEIYFLQKEIRDLKQGNDSVESYFSKLKVLWELIESTRTTIGCHCTSAAEQEKEKQNDRLIEFLMGLNSIFKTIRSKILLMDPLPNPVQAYILVKEDEEQRQLTVSNMQMALSPNSHYHPEKKQNNDNLKGPEYSKVGQLLDQTNSMAASTSGKEKEKGASLGLDFGDTYVVYPKGKHRVTIVWIHGLGDNGENWSQIMQTLPLPDIKWICPTAPSRPVKIFGGLRSPAWFDADEKGPADIESMDASAAHIANLLSSEPADITLAVGGFSMGAATALYFSTCYVKGRYGNGEPFHANLSAVVGLSGWLPFADGLSEALATEEVAVNGKSSLPFLLCHGEGDEVIDFKCGDNAVEQLTSSGFTDVTFKPYEGLGHHTAPQEMEDICTWLNSKLGMSSVGPP